MWIQNETPDKKNTYIIDGVVSTFSATKDQEDAMEILVKAHDWKRMYESQINGLIKKKKISSSFVWYQGRNGIMIKSCHQERDEVNRLMSFMFYTTSIDIDEAISKLKDYSMKVGRTCFENDLQAASIIKKKQKIKVGFFISLLLILLILLWMI